MTLKVAVAQYDVPLDTKDSLAKLNEVAKKASSAGVKLLVAPETAIGKLADVKSASSNYYPAVSRIAKENNIFLASSVYRKKGEQVFNEGFIISKEGEVVHRYRKIYLAPPEAEEDKISPGKYLTVADSTIGKLGMLICKDGFNKYSHFLYEKLNTLETQITCIPSWSLGTWDINTQEYIKALYTYGAFTSRSYVLVAGNLNEDTKSFGRSLIISPVDGVLKEGSSDKEELLTAEIDLDILPPLRAFDARWQPKTRII